MKKVVRFDEQVTVMHGVTVVVEQVRNSHSKSNSINHVCRRRRRRREDKDDATIEIDPSNELLPQYLPVFSTVDECHEDEGPIAIHYSTVLKYHNFSSPTTDSNHHYRSCRWRMNKEEMDDITPILPRRQDSISKELFNPDQHHDVLRPSNAYNWKKNHDSISKQLFIPDQHQDVLPPSKAYSISKELFIPDQHHVVLPPSNAYNGKTNRAA